MDIARVINLVLVALQVRGLMLSGVSERRWMLFAFYTQLSNLLAGAASLLLVVLGQPAWITVLRYLSVCMLVMTALVTVCVLVPMGGDPHWLLWSGNGIYHHVVIPVLSTLSYVFLEAHAPSWTLVLPVVVTLVYGLVLLWLNWRGVVDGPYPFFRVREQSPTATVLWVVVLLLAIAGIAAGVQFVAA